MSPRVLMHQGTPITWKSPGQGGTHKLSLAGLGPQQARLGDLHDFGTSPRSRKFRWRGWFRGGEITPGSDPRPLKLGYFFAPMIFLITSDGAHPDAPNIKDGDSLFTIDREYLTIRSLGLGSIITSPQLGDQNPSVEYVGRGTIEIEDQFIAPVMLNTCLLPEDPALGGLSTFKFTTDPSHHGLELIPIPDEIVG